jgi:hypothetical protein
VERTLEELRAVYQRRVTAPTAPRTPPSSASSPLPPPRAAAAWAVDEATVFAEADALAGRCARVRALAVAGARFAALLRADAPAEAHEARAHARLLAAAVSYFTLSPRRIHPTPLSLPRTVT